MLHPDPRAYRVALLADAIANGDSGESGAPFDVLAVLETAQWGVIVPPPSDFAVSTIEGIVEYMVDDLCEYRASGYRVVIIGTSAIEQFGVWAAVVDGEIARRGAVDFERFDVAGASRSDFEAFLRDPLPAALADR